MYVELRKEIAAILNWSEADINSFSLPSLGELVRPLSPDLAARIAAYIAKGNHIQGARHYPKKR